MTVSSVAVARAVLLAALPGVKVSTVMEVTDRRRVRISRAGGSRRYALDSPRILLECYASTSAGAPDGVQAEQDALDAYDALAVAANGGPWAGGWVTGWDGNSIADYPDPTQTRYARWQFTGELYVLRS